MTTEPPIVLVLHPLGDPGGGGPWRAAFGAAGWPGEVVAPDLPGHAGAAPPVGGCYELSDPAFAVAALDLPVPVDLVVGVGASGWGAQLVALGGRARAVVLVDGLGRPWRTTDQRFAETFLRLRALEQVPHEAGAPAGGLDPALAHPPLPHGDRELARRALDAHTGPLLLLEPSDTDRDDLDELLGGRSAPTAVEVVDSRHPDAVAAAVTSWWRTMST